MTTARVVAIGMVKDERDVVEGWVRHHLDEVDAMVVVDNMSTDGTRDILGGLSRWDDRLTVLDDDDPAYRQSAKMTRLAEWAAIELGAEWIVPVDADELWVQPVDRIRTVLPAIGYPIVTAELVNHVRTGDDVDHVDPFRSMVWRLEAPQKLGKVAFRWAHGAVIHQGNHGVTLPSGETGGLQVLHVHHFPVRSPEQYVRKARNGAAAYAAAPEVQGGDHWKSWGRLTDEQLAAAFAEHWYYTSPVDVGRVRGDGVGLVRDPAPYRRWETTDDATTV
jgi:hypothetical protein